MTSKNYKPGWRSQNSRSNSHLSTAWAKKAKTILPIAILFSLATIFIWPKLTHLFAKKSQSQVIGKVLKDNPLLEDMIINPQLDSLDKKGRPFLIQAESASNLNNKKIDFIKPSGHMQLEDGSVMNFAGDKGNYTKEEDVLEVFDNIQIQTDKGYNLKTEYMRLHPKENIGQGDKPIFGTGPSGETIEADGFKITDKGDIIEFLGKTKISLPER